MKDNIPRPGRGIASNSAVSPEPPSPQTHASPGRMSGSACSMHGRPVTPSSVRIAGPYPADPDLRWPHPRRAAGFRVERPVGPVRKSLGSRTPRPRASINWRPLGVRPVRLFHVEPFARPPEAAWSQDCRPSTLHGALAGIPPTPHAADPAILLMRARLKPPGPKGVTSIPKGSASIRHTPEAPERGRSNGFIDGDRVAAS